MNESCVSNTENFVLDQLNLRYVPRLFLTQIEKRPLNQGCSNSISNKTFPIPVNAWCVFVEHVGGCYFSKRTVFRKPGFYSDCKHCRDKIIEASSHSLPSSLITFIQCFVLKKHPLNRSKKPNPNQLSGMIEGRSRFVLSVDARVLWLPTAQFVQR